MQSVLSIDASCDPAAAVVVQVDGNTAVVQEIHRFSLGSLFSREELLGLNKAANQDATASTVAEPSSAVPSNADINVSDELRKALSAIKTPWTSSILLVPPHDYLSLNIDLPFARSKGMDNIVNLEVQDLVPFDLGEFLVQYKSLGPLSDKEQDIHVSLLPREALSKVLGHCKKAGFEPAMVSTPASVLGAVPLLGAEESRSTAVILARDPYIYIAILIDGDVRMDRIINRSALTQSVEGLLDPICVRELRATLILAERRYGKKISQTFLLGSANAFDLSAALSIPVIPVSMPELVKSSDNSTTVACLASLYAQDISPPPILTNFRIKEFAYSPQMRELLTGLRSLLPYILALLVAAAILFIGMYSARERRLSTLKNAVREQIREAIPSLDVAPGNEMDALEGENRKLEQQLSNLGSLSALSPLDYLLEISDDLPLSSGISITRIKIEGNKLRVDGTAPDYAAMEKIERILKKKKGVYCRIRKETTASVAGKPNLRGFSFDLLLCE